MLANCYPVNFLEWTMEVLMADSLSSTQKLVAIATVAFQDAHNEYLQERCGIGRTALKAAKKALTNKWIDPGPIRGRGMARKYTGVTPDGKICYLEKGAQPDPSFVSGVLESPTLIEPDSGSDVEPVTSEKGSNSGSFSGSFSGSNSGSQRGSNSDPLKGSPPPKEYISNPPPLPNERENRAREPIQKNLDLKIDDSYIEGPGFRIDLQAVDMAAALTGYKHDARKLAELMARDWVANNFTPESPMGKIRWAMKNDHNDDQQQSARREKIQNGTSYRGGSSGRKSNDEYADQDAAAAAANRVMERLKADAACN